MPRRRARGEKGLRPSFGLRPKGEARTGGEAALLLETLTARRGLASHQAAKP